MESKIIVFDFDGTLVDSQKLKLETYYGLFPPDAEHKKIISEILEKIPEEPRHKILETILTRIGYKYEDINRKVIELGRAYGDIVEKAVGNCREMPGATEVLKYLYSRYVLYASSGTPVESLRGFVEARGWAKYFKDVFGYPDDKKSVLERIMNAENVGPDGILVVGDGESDRVSAEIAGCRFFRIENDGSLLELKTELA